MGTPVEESNHEAFGTVCPCGLGYGYAGYGLGYAGYRGHYIGKREAEAEPGYLGLGLGYAGYGLGGYYGYGGHYIGKREAEADASLLYAHYPAVYATSYVVPSYAAGYLVGK